MPKIFLASTSPRRKEILQSAGLSFEVLAIKVSEIPTENLMADEKIIQIARQKLDAAITLLKSSEKSDFVIICSDTEVVLDEQLLGKPRDHFHAAQTLKKLSGREHQVKTAVCVFDSKSSQILEDIETTNIQFKNLSEQQIQTYVQSGDPMDKAGSYGLQNIEKEFIEKISGAKDNVIGLPLNMTLRLLSSLEIYRSTKQSNAVILAVSKFQPAIKIQRLYRSGQIDFAENYVQEFLAKYEQLKDLPIRWHFIGHLQSNKIKQIVGKVAIIHSVDSVTLAKKIDAACASMGIIQNVLLQVNLSGEQSKGGFSKSNFEASINELRTLKNIHIIGLMTMPPLQNQAEQNNNLFNQLKQLGEQYGLHQFSMGTSHDYKVALSAGATFIRIGTALFGERKKQKEINI